MKDYRALIQVKATGRRKIVKLAESITNVEDARKALDIRYGDNVKVLMIIDCSQEM